MLPFVASLLSKDKVTKKFSKLSVSTRNNWIKRNASVDVYMLLNFLSYLDFTHSEVQRRSASSLSDDDKEEPSAVISSWF